MNGRRNLRRCSSACARAQFRSFRLPPVILTPIPLTFVGIVLGHMLFGAPFTATSMIGFIALAGIIVRNSILLVGYRGRRVVSAWFDDFRDEQWAHSFPTPLDSH